jgi:hypothetical protein
MSCEVVALNKSKFNTDDADSTVPPTRLCGIKTHINIIVKIKSAWQLPFNTNHQTQK